jgi:TRAP transporter TAXI family solute receptor
MLRWFVLVALSAHAALAWGQELVILTGGTSGVYYPLGQVIKRFAERELPGAKITVVSTQATVENLNLLQQGRGVLALAQGDILGEAWRGNPEAGFPSSRTKIRLVGAAYPNVIHIIARRDAGIRSVSDLRSKRVSVGAARSGNELNARALLGAQDISYADLLQVEYLEYGQSVDLMLKGQLDAAIISAGLGVAAVHRAMSQGSIELVPVESPLIAKTRNLFYPFAIPAGSYPGQKGDVPAAGLNNYFVTTADAPDDTVYRLTKAIYGNIAELRKAHTATAQMSAEKALAIRPIGVHPGALRYFREAGIAR